MSYISLGSCRQKVHFSCSGDVDHVRKKSGGIGQYVKIHILLDYPLIAGTFASMFRKTSSFNFRR